MSLLQKLKETIESILFSSNPEVKGKLEIRKLESDLKNIQPEIYKNYFATGNVGQAFYVLYQETTKVSQILSRTICSEDAAIANFYSTMLIKTGYQGEALDNLNNLNYDYVNRHPLNEIYYRLFDDYTKKSIKLTSLYSFINDSISIILTLLVLFLYSYNYAILFLIIVFPIVLIMNKISKKICILLETKRKAELEFYAYYIDSFNNKDDIYVNLNKEYENKSYELLKEYQESDYKLEKYNNLKNYLLLVFQSLIISSLIILYFVTLKNTMTIGKLVTLISIISSILSPLLNILSRVTDFSNYKLIDDRLKELDENKKNDT